MRALSTTDTEAIPYVLDVRAVEREDGEWVCRVSYDELPDCVAEDFQILAALEKVERKRRDYFRRSMAAPPPERD
jgi:hypothetical protein